MREKQSRFVRLIGELIEWVYLHPRYALTFGDFFAHDGHMANSVHYDRLAADMNLFVDGVWMDKDCPEWQAIGARWLTMDREARWGGTFETVDLNHFSLEDNGRA